jgi:hypothetical protein
MEMEGLIKKGATAQSWSRELSIRVVIRELQTEHPKANENRLVKLLQDRCRDDEDAFEACCAYAVKNNLSAQASYHRKPKTSEERAAENASIQQAAKQIAEKILLLNIEMPNGKRLRFCTGTYIEKLGGGLAKAGKKAGAMIMGQVFDEKSLREIIAA